MELILASTSASRRALMDALGVSYRAIAPGVEETSAGSVEATVRTLAEKKAHAVASRFSDAIVVGADQLVCRDGVALGKPHDAVQARAQLASLCGRSHEILTGVCVLAPGFRAVEVDVARLRVWPLSNAELDAYVATNEWQGCAGGYRIEARGQAIFEHIEGDRTAIQGLPMQFVVRMLRAAGYRFFF